MGVIDFGDLKGEASLAKMNAHFLDASYVSSFVPSQDDNLLVQNVVGAYNTQKYAALTRWYTHILSYSRAERSMWPAGAGVKGVQGAKPAAPKPVEEEDDDFDPFAEETEEDKAAKAKVADKAKAAKPKKKVIDKSTLVIEVKPGSSETDLGDIEKLVRQIAVEGLEWSQASKRLPIAFGLMKLQIGCTIVDELVNTEELVDQIECIGLNKVDSLRKLAIRDGEIDEDDDDDELGIVQSASIVSFNKL